MNSQYLKGNNVPLEDIINLINPETFFRDHWKCILDTTKLEECLLFIKNKIDEKEEEALNKLLKFH